MRKEKKLSPKRMIELEQWLIDNNFLGQDELQRLAELNGFNQIEIDYLLNALCVPLSDMQSQLAIYDSTRPRMDELKFVAGLANKHSTERNNILRRIRQTRIIDRYIKQNPNIDFGVKQQGDVSKKLLKEKNKRP